MIDTLTLPRNKDIEKLVLGALLLSGSPEQIKDAREKGLAPDCFMAQAREVYDCLCDMAERGDSINPVVLLTRLRERGSHVDHVTVSAIIDGVPRFANESLASEIRILRDLATRRAILNYANYLAVESQAKDVDVPALLEGIKARASGFEEVARGGNNSVLGRIVSARTLLETEYPEPKWAVRGLIPEGVTFIAGPPKLGKSIFSLNIAVAVSSEGGKALSCFNVEHGSVLYLALEDGPRRIQERLQKLTGGHVSNKLEIVNEWPRVNQGGLDAIDAWIKSKPDARLLIVDTLKMLRPLASGHERNAYDTDYEAIQPLTKLVSQRVALAVVHHTRKAIADDPLATVSGSYGLTGAADGVLVLSRRRGRSDATLSVIGRDVEEQELALEFKPDMCLWSSLGKADEIKRSGERQEIIDLFKQSGEPLTPASIASLLDKEPRVVRNLLWKMKGAGEIKLIGSRYQLPNYQSPEPTKIRKSKKDKSISGISETVFARDAGMSNTDNGLNGNHLGVSAFTQNGNGSGVHNGDAEMETSQLLTTIDIEASRHENISRDAEMFEARYLDAIDD